MACTKRLLIIALAMVLSACEMAGKKAVDSSVDETEVQSESDGTEKIVALPNPYLAQSVDVPREAAAEFNRALAVMENGDWEKAEGMLFLLTETWPNLSGPWVNLGIAQAQQKKWQDAEASFTKAINVNALNGDAYTHLGVLYREQGKFAEAETTYLKALEVWPHNPDALRNLGILYDLYMGKLAQALAQYQLLAKILPEENRKLKGWIIDLERRVEDAQPEAATE
ncbi:tetratricopeptide repeat protein [Teredinibacter turnerae]|uniref:tetratricopeptide repeat protein n=1 Tax=Teredinibacter turnerae TaxID=2426 RepID=UPI000374552D|nr:tetratricopeptide repeat protein [Teredinibacter turnerae]